MHIYSFEKLDVWIEARQLVKWIYLQTSTFPADEKFGLIMQLRKQPFQLYLTWQKEVDDKAHEIRHIFLR